MKQIYYWIALFAFFPNYSLEVVHKIKNNFESSLQESFPNWYLEKWCKGNASTESMENAIRDGRNSFFQLAFVKQQEKGEITPGSLSCFFKAAVVGENVLGVEFLLDKGADVNGTDEEGKTPLHVALQCQNYYIPGMLLARKPNLQLIDKAGNSIFSLIKRNTTAKEFPLFAQFLAHYHKEQVKQSIQAIAKEETLYSFSSYAGELRSFLLEWARKDDELGYLVCQEILNFSKEQLRDFAFKLNEKQRIKIGRRFTINEAKRLLAKSPEAYRYFYPKLPLADIAQDIDYVHLIKQNYSVGDWSQTDEAGNNLLMIAARLKASTFSRILNDYSFTGYEKNKAGDTALSIAISVDNQEAIQALLSAHPELLADEDKKTSDALKVACPAVQSIFENGWHEIYQAYARIGILIGELRQAHKKIRASKENEINASGLKDFFLERYRKGIEPSHVGSCYDPIVPLMQLIVDEKDIPEPDSIGFLNLVLAAYTKDRDMSVLKNLEKLEELLKKNLSQEKSLLEREQSCVVCGNQYDQKKWLTVCHNNHTICLACYNAPQLDKCPTCRELLHVDKLKVCQKCCSGDENSKLYFCATCDHALILCGRCFIFPCCNSPILNGGVAHFVYHLKAVEFANKYIEHCTEKARKEFQDFQIKTNKETEREINEIDARFTMLDSQIRTLAHQIDESSTYSNDLINKHNELAKEANELIDKRNTLAIELHFCIMAKSTSLNNMLLALKERLVRMCQLQV